MLPFSLLLELFGLQIYPFLPPVLALFPLLRERLADNLADLPLGFSFAAAPSGMVAAGRACESLCEPGLLGSDRSSRRPSCWDPRRGRWENRMEPDWKPASSSPRVPRPRAPPPRRPGRPQPLPIGYGAHPAAGRFRNR